MGLYLRRWNLSALVLLIGGAIVARVFFTSVTIDDAYITLRYARNLAEGFGFVFNVGERVYGTTTPLYTIVLAAIHVVYEDPLLIGKLLNIVADVGVVLIVYRIALMASRQRWVGYLCAVLYALNPVAIKWSALGMETGLYTFAIAATFFLYAKKNYPLAYLAAGMAALIRVEGVLVIGVVAGFDLLHRRWSALRSMWLGVIPVAVWMVFAYGYFGSPLPHSAAAKYATYGGVHPWDGLQEVVRRTLFRYSWITVGAAVLALIGLIRSARDSRWHPLIAWWCIYWSFFVFSGSKLQGWYTAPPLWVYTLWIGLGIFYLEEIGVRFVGQTRLFHHWRASIRLALIATIVVVAVLVVQSRHRDVVGKNGGFQNQVLRPVSTWLAEHAQPADTVCLESIGMVGYVSRCYILDAVGLVSPQVLPLNRLHGRGPNFGAIVQRYTPEYYVSWDTWEMDWWNRRPELRAWLDSNYVKRITFKGPADAAWSIRQRHF